MVNIFELLVEYYELHCARIRQWSLPKNRSPRHYDEPKPRPSELVYSFCCRSYYFTLNRLV